MKKMRKTKAKTRKISVIFITIVLLMSTSVFLYASSVIDDPIEIKLEDKNLFEEVKLFFDGEGMKWTANYETLTITASEEQLSAIEEVSFSNAGISDISGLENFVNLKKVNLASNQITDITALANLNLTSLNLSNNAGIKIYDKNTGTCYLPNQSYLQELYISSTGNSDISFIENLTSLRTLDISNNGISSLKKIVHLNNLEVLNASANNITTIDEIISIKTLKELNIGSTNITNLLHSDFIYDEYEHGIFDLVELETLNVENNKLSIEPIYKTYYVESGDINYVPYLKNLKKLNFNYTEQEYVDFWSLSQLTNLTHLDMAGNGIYYIDENITTLSNLEYINLANNNIEDINGFVRYDAEGKIESVLSAKEINLANNYVEDITILTNLEEIIYLDLSQNEIFYVDAIDNGRFSFSKGLDLRNQGRGKFDEEGEEQICYWSIKDKEADKNQYIFLPTLFQNSKQEGSIVHSEDIEFVMENISLNSDELYNVPGKYNVIIEALFDIDGDGTNDEKILSITLKGGCADGSKLYFKIEDNYDSIDSMFFKDENLANAIRSDLLPKALANDDLYVKSELNILNITYSLIGDTTTLDLKNKDIVYLDGISSFENLTHLNLSNNRISTIDEIAYCVYLEELYIANNPNIGNNNSAIENMLQLRKLDLSTTGMTNLNSLKKLINKWSENGYFTLTELNISNNILENIDEIEKISSLEKLNISNIGINEISNIKLLTNLKDLNVSMNEIDDISCLKNLTKLKYLSVSNNKIKDIIPISNISLDSLDFSNNKVEDIRSLKIGYTTLNMDANEIRDISNLDGKLIANFSVRNQKILYAIDSELEQAIIPLPEIFKDSRKSTSKVYSNKNFVLTNCNLTTDGSSVVVNQQELGNNIASVMINGGNAHQTSLLIATPLKGTITYNPSNETPTNQDIIATITFNRTATITNNEGKNTYTFDQNGEFTFEYVDEYGFEGTATAKVENIDKVAPRGTMKQEIVDKKVVVTISVSEEIMTPDTWTQSSDKSSIIKTYSNDANETVKLKDLAGNETSIQVQVKIDKTVPVITGVKNGEKYNKAVTPIITDENLKTITLTKDGVKINGYKSGTTIKDAGQYVLIATDIFDNTTTVSFEIEISDIITSRDEHIIVLEEELIIKGITSETKIGDLKNKLSANMNYEIIDKNGNAVSTTSNVGTGFKIKMANNKTYTLIITGDVTGDGKAELRDILAINKHRLGKAILTNEYLLAGDVNEDGKADLRDILQINKFRLGKINEL